MTWVFRIAATVLVGVMLWVCCSEEAPPEYCHGTALFIDPSKDQQALINRLRVGLYLGVEQDAAHRTVDRLLGR